MSDAGRSGDAGRSNGAKAGAGSIVQRLWRMGGSAPQARTGTGPDAGLLGNIAVTKGRHTGATLPIRRSRLTIGSTLGSDMVLTDPNITHRHCSLLFGDGNTGVTILADGGDVRVGAEHVDAGSRTEAVLPFKLQIGGAELDVTGPPPQKIGARKLGMLTLAALGAGGIAYQIATSGTPLPPQQILPPRTALTQPPKASDQSTRALGDRLKQAGLDKSLNVERRGGVLVVEGTLDSAGYASWREAKQAFLGTGSDVPAIVDAVKISTLASVPRGLVASVVYRPTPHVVSKSGRRARVGETLDDGWIVEQINAESVQLRRGRTVANVNTSPNASPTALPGGKP